MCSPTRGTNVRTHCMQERRESKRMRTPFNWGVGDSLASSWLVFSRNFALGISLGYGYLHTFCLATSSQLLRHPNWVGKEGCAWEACTVKCKGVKACSSSRTSPCWDFFVCFCYTSSKPKQTSILMGCPILWLQTLGSSGDSWKKLKNISRMTMIRFWNYILINRILTLET